jgi:predicted RNA polymerase sigma factor
MCRLGDRGLYELLACLAPGPMVTLNRIVAVGMVRGPAVALEQLDTAETNPALAGHYRVDAVRAHLLDETGQHDAAREHYRRAARHTLSLPEQRYLLTRAIPPPIIAMTEVGRIQPAEENTDANDRTRGTA